MATTQPFQWGMGGQQITSPEQAARKRAVAEALIAQSGTPGRNWAEGLADVAAALSGTVLEGRVSEAEQAGRERAGGLFADLAVNADPNSIIAALTSPDAAWASPAQTSIASALLNSGLERQDPMYQAQLAKLQADVANGGQGAETFFGNIVPMQDAEGNVVLGQASNQGNWQPLQGAEGFSPAPTTKQIDTGTEIITTDVYGNELYRTPKENRQAAYETGFGGVEGKTDAENVALAESVQSKMPGLRSVIDELTALADTATYTQSGQVMDSVKRELGLPVGQGAIDRASYIAIVDNQVLPLLKDTFGAAFTVAEGQSLRATLGDPNKSPQEKKAILDAFIQQKERDVAAMQRKAPGGAVDQGANAPAPVVRVFNPATGRLE
jgi:hypothetical protein